jgi:hypothetical protein
MEAQIKGSMTKKFVLYSGHDSTMTALLSALDAFDGQRPAYAARVLFELWRAKEPTIGYLVRVLYNGCAIQSSIISGLMSFTLFRKNILSGYLRDPVSHKNACLKGVWEN